MPGPTTGQLTVVQAWKGVVLPAMIAVELMHNSVPGCVPLATCA